MIRQEFTDSSESIFYSCEGRTKFIYGGSSGAKGEAKVGERHTTNLATKGLC